VVFVGTVLVGGHVRGERHRVDASGTSTSRCRCADQPSRPARNGHGRRRTRRAGASLGPSWSAQGPPLLGARRTIALTVGPRSRTVPAGADPTLASDREPAGGSALGRRSSYDACALSGCRARTSTSGGTGGYAVHDDRELRGAPTSLPLGGSVGDDRPGRVGTSRIGILVRKHNG
jgi:hypothetical protein